jgi:predicted nucleotide-binding protein (sugar kinase/HSP70/actin superfamily)
MNYLINHITIPRLKQLSNITIGLPKAMMFYEHGRLWEKFFKELGCKVVSSGDTSRQILDLGVKYSSNETCLPVKVLTGHVAVLSDKSDYVFVPRYTSTDVHEYTCPKMCGLPDMIRHGFKKPLQLMEVAVDFNKGDAKTVQSLRGISKTLGCEYENVSQAFFKIVKDGLKGDMEIADTYPIRQKNKPCIAVLGHPYMIYDNFLSMNLIQKLRAKNYYVLTPANLKREVKRSNAQPYKAGSYFYGVGFENIGSVFAFAQDSDLKGIIYLTPFACGIDSLVTEFIEQRLKNNRQLPFMKITIDEHTGETGFDTRIEAFLDMLVE